MQKHTICVFCAICVDIFCYLAFDIFIWSKGIYVYDATLWQFAFLLVDIDMVIKTITCFLMFKFYENTFFKLCCCCIKIATFDCHCSKESQSDNDYPRIISRVSIFEPLAQKAKGTEYIGVWIYFVYKL